MSSSKTYYLSKDGKTFGPMSQVDIEALKKTPEYLSYTWLWDSSTPGWVPVNPPPPPPAAEFAKTKNDKALKGLEFQAICHNNQVILSGSLLAMNKNDCMFISQASDDALPVFGKGNTVTINLLHEKSGKAENAHAKIVHTQRVRDHWEYQLQWVKTPSLVALEVVQ